MAKPTLFFYCQHSLGMGHWVRALTLAEALAGEFNVLFFNGGRLPGHTDIPAGIDMINLPPLGMDTDNQLYSQSVHYSVAEAKLLRQKMLLAAMHYYQPHVILIELFPFGRKKFAGELIPWLKAAKRYQEPKRPLVLCSLRDIMVNARKDQQRHDNRARWLVNRYFDALLVHADPIFARLEESFKPTLPLAKPVHYTGFVLPRGNQKLQTTRQHRLLVSAGGGMVGAPLFQVAVKAQPLLWAKFRLPMTLIAGPFLPETDWQELLTQSTHCPGLTLHRHVPDMVEFLANHAISVSQCGYNTVMDILKSGISSLVVPFSQGQEDEQQNRAQRLSDLGLLRTVAADVLDVECFVAEVEKLLTFRPNTNQIDIHGTERSVSIIRNLWAKKNTFHNLQFHLARQVENG